MRKTNHWVKVVGLLMTGGVVLQFGGCGGLFKQVGLGLGFSLGTAPGTVVGCLATNAAGLGCAEGSDAIILGD